MKRLVFLSLLAVLVYGCAKDPTSSKEIRTVTDTLIVVDTVYDTTAGAVDTLVVVDTLVDTISISTMDTLFLVDTIIDTVIVVDTLLVDTVYHYDTAVITDTAILVVYDTTWVFDTVFSVDTLVVVDTVNIFDTTVVVDTVNIHDTTVVYDTTLVTDTLVVVPPWVPNLNDFYYVLQACWDYWEPKGDVNVPCWPTVNTYDETGAFMEIYSFDGNTLHCVIKWIKDTDGPNDPGSIYRYFKVFWLGDGSWELQTSALADPATLVYFQSWAFDGVNFDPPF